MQNRYRFNTAIFLRAGWSLLFAGNLLCAKPPDLNQPDDLYNLSIEQLMEVDINTVFAASKHEQKTADAPSSVFLITADDIKKYGYRTMQDILQSVPGFYTTYDRNYGYLAVRGFGRPGDYNSRILVLLDGHRLNDNVGGLWGLMRDFHIDVDLIKKVEVVRGPGSALYGSNALFAVINIITKGAEDFRGSETAFSCTSDDAAQGRLTYGNVLKNNINLLVSGTYYDWEGETLYYPEFDDPATNFGRADNDDEQAGSFFVKSAVSDFTLTAAHVDREKGVPTASWDTVFNQPESRTWDAFTFLGLTWQREMEQDLTILSRISYNEYDYDGRFVYDDGGLYRNKDCWKGRWWIGELQVTKIISDRQILILGAEGQYNVRQDQKNWDSDIYLDSRRHSKSWGVYLQDEYKLLDQVTLFGGIRQDYYESIGHQMSPRLGLIYQPFETTAVKLLYGKAFRAPSAYELYYTDGATHRVNSDLDAETIKTYEIVLEQILTENLRGTVSAYYYRMENLIDQAEDGGWIFFDNLSEVTAKGFETALEGRWDSGMRTRLAYAYVRAEDKKTGEWMANSPEHMIHFNWIYPLISNRVFAGIESKYSSKRKTLSGSRTDDAIVTNLTFTCENLVKNLDLQVGIYNLFDEAYDHPGFLEHQQDVLEQDGRSAGFKLFYRF